MAATTTAISAGGAPESLRPVASSTDMTSAKAPISTTPTTITATERLAGSLSSRRLARQAFLPLGARIGIAEEIGMCADLHAQEEGIERDHRADGEDGIEVPALTRHEFRHDHGNAHRRQDHHTCMVFRIVVVGLFAVADAAEEGGEAEDAVDIQHDGRVDRVAHQRRRGLALHHDGEHYDLHQHGRERQDHRAVGIADLGGGDFGVVGDAG